MSHNNRCAIVVSQNFPEGNFVGGVLTSTPHREPSQQVGKIEAYGSRCCCVGAQFHIREPVPVEFDSAGDNAFRIECAIYEANAENNLIRIEQQNP